MLVGRELCLFLALDATHVPAKQRRELVRLAVKRAAPFADPEFDAAWIGGRAAVWFWSADDIARRVASLTGVRLRLFAEARFLGSHHASGVERLSLGQGVAARVWRDGALVADRWWVEAPAPNEWERFLRGASAPAVDPCTHEAVVDADLPWDRRTSSGAGTLFSQFTVREWLLVPTLLAAVTVGTFAGAFLRNAIALQGMRGDVERLTESAGEILDARTAAEGASTRAQALLGLHRHASPVVYADGLATALEGQAWELRSLAVDEAGLMTATLEMPNVDPANLVATVEATPRLTDATVEIVPNSRQVVLRARDEPAADAQTADPAGTPP